MGRICLTIYFGFRCCSRSNVSEHWVHCERIPLLTVRTEIAQLIVPTTFKGSWRLSKDCERAIFWQSPRPFKSSGYNNMKVLLCVSSLRSRSARPPRGNRENLRKPGHLKKHHPETWKIRETETDRENLKNRARRLQTTEKTRKIKTFAKTRENLRKTRQLGTT